MMQEDISIVPLVANGDFEQWEAGRPVGWELGEGTYQRDTIMRVSGSASLKMTSDRGQQAAWLHTRIRQRVELEPGQRYRLRWWMAKDSQGYVHARVQRVVQGRVVAEDAPLQWNNGWARPFPWSPIELTFEIPAGGDRQTFELSFLQFGGALEPAWIDRVELVAESGRPGPSADRAAGGDASLALFSPSIMHLPHAGDQSPWVPAERVHVTAAGDTFAPVALVARADRALPDLELVLEAPLRGAVDGGELSPEAVVIRTLRPEDALLPQSRPEDLAAGAARTWWITVHATVPADTYHGRLAVRSGGRELRTLPFSVEVLPWTLPESPIAMLVYHNERYFPAGPYLSDELRQAYYQDMRDHGMTTVTVYSNPDGGREGVDFDRDYGHAPGLMNLEAMNRRGYQLTDEAVLERHHRGLNAVLPMIRQAGLPQGDLPVLWLAHKAGTYNWGGLPEAAMKQTLDHWLAQSDWPRPLLYVSDEPDGHPERIAEARRLLDQIQTWQLPVRTVTANVAIKELGSDYDVWIQLEKRIRPEMAEQAREHGADLWIYNCNTHTSNGPLTRAMFGFWAHRAGIQGVALWAYYDGLNWHMDEDGQVHGRNGQFGFSRICPSPQGPVPTVSWETTREGVYDYRYALLLDQLIDQLEARVADLATEVAQTLSEEERQGIVARRQQANRKAEEGETPLPAWTASEQVAVQWMELQHELAMAQGVRERLIHTIPYDIFALHGAYTFGQDTVRHYPAIAPGDAAIAAEQKRQTIVAHIGRLHAVLAR